MVSKKRVGDQEKRLQVEIEKNRRLQRLLQIRRQKELAKVENVYTAGMVSLLAEYDRLMRELTRFEG